MATEDPPEAPLFEARPAVTATHGGPPPWRYVIEDAAGRVLASGQQWTHPLAAARVVAEERIAVFAYRMLRAGRRRELAGVSCRVWRPSNPEVRVTVSATAWVSRTSTQPARVR